MRYAMGGYDYQRKEKSPATELNEWGDEPKPRGFGNWGILLLCVLAGLAWVIYLSLNP